MDGGVAHGVGRAQTLRREMEKEKEEEKPGDEEAGRVRWDRGDRAAGKPMRVVIGWIRTPEKNGAGTHTFKQHTLV